MQTERRREADKARHRRLLEAETPERRAARLARDREGRRRGKEEEGRRKARLATKIARWAEQNRALGWG